MDDHQLEYQEYQKSLLDNNRFLDSFNDKYYETHRFYRDQKHGHSYHFFSMALLILGSVLISFYISLFSSSNNEIRNIIFRIVLFILAITSFFISYLLSAQHDKMLTYAFFDRYIRPQLLQERVNYDIKNLISRDQERYKELLRKAEDEAIYLLDPENKQMQQEYEEHIKMLSLTALKLYHEHNNNCAKKTDYSSFTQQVLTDYTLYIAINKKLNI